MCPFKMTKDLYDQVISEISSKLLNMKMADGRISYELKLKKDTEGPSIGIIFSMQAYIKMTALINVYETEVGWRGLVQKIDDKNYYIYDILMYPQYITATTVTTKEEEYNDWMDKLDDESFQDLRFYGHSHVNMGTEPSAVDMDERQRIVDQMNDEDFVLFGIFNKRGDFNFTLYDSKTGMMYDRHDIFYYVELEDGNSLHLFLEDALKYTKKEEKKPEALRVMGDSKSKKKKDKSEKKSYYNGYYYEDSDDDYEVDYKYTQHEYGYDKGTGYSYPF